jgi:Helix-turn-helix domain
MEERSMSDMTLSEAAKAVGKSAVTLRGAVNQGKLKSYMKGRTHMVSLNDVVALFAERSSSDGRSGASVARLGPDSAHEALVSALQSQVRALENERDFLRRMLEQANAEKASLVRDLVQRTAEIKAFLENKSGLFKFLGR